MAIALAVTAAACDFQPGPPKHTAPTPVPEGSAAPVQADTPPPAPPLPPQTVPPPADAAPAPPPVAEDAAPERSAECLAAGSHFAQLMIDHAADAQTKAQYEQDRARMVKSLADVCTRTSWTPAQVSCVTAATTPEAARDCVRPAKRPDAPPPPDDHVK